MNTIPVLHSNEFEEDRPGPSLNCWVVIPGTETISVFPQSGPSHSLAEGIVQDETLGVEVALADVFS